MQPVLSGGVTEVWRSPKVPRSWVLPLGPKPVPRDRTVTEPPEPGRGEGTAGQLALWVPGSPGRGGRGLPGPSRASLEGKDPASTWRRLHLPVNSRRQKARLQLRSEKAAGRQWGSRWPSSLPSHLSRRQTRQMGPWGWAKPGEGPPKH